MFLLLGCAADGGMESSEPRAADVCVADEVADREHEAAIREAILDDPELSPLARQVVVQAENGVVTLSGSVLTLEERARVQHHAGRCPATTSLVNRIVVVPA